MTSREGEEGERGSSTAPADFDTLLETLAEEVHVFDAAGGKYVGAEDQSQLAGEQPADLAAVAEELVGEVFDSYRAGKVDLDTAESQLEAGLSSLLEEEGGNLQQEATIDSSWVIDALPTPAFVVGVDHTILAYNEPLADLIGIDPNGAVGKDSRHITASAYTDDRREQSLADKVIEAPRHAEEEFDVERVDSMDIYSGEYVYHDTSVLHNRRGEEVEIAFVAVPVFDSTDELQAVLELIVENTGRTLEEFPGLASVVSHDIRNPLSVIRSYVELAEEDIDDEYYEATIRNIARIENIIDDVMTLSESANEHIHTEKIHVSKMAQTVWGSLETDDATLETEPVAVEAAPHLMDRLLENLLSNAVEHGSTSNQPSPDDAVEHGSASNQPSPDDAVEHGSTSNQPSPDDAAEHGGGVTVRVGPLSDGFFVEDDGAGIPPEERDAVFEHGYTTTDRGTGFGLPIVHTIVSNHDWQISLMDSEEGGARFEIRTDEGE